MQCYIEGTFQSRSYGKSSKGINSNYLARINVHTSERMRRMKIRRVIDNTPLFYNFARIKFFAMKRAIIYMLAVLAAVGCGSNRSRENKTVYVTIAPLKQIVESITGDDFEVGILVPAGASPETYEPTPRQMKELDDASLIFSTGLLDFETALTAKIRQQPVNLSQGIDLIAGCCSHGDGAHKHGGTDPHIWTSPACLVQMAQTAFDAIHAAYPDSAKYEANYNVLRERLRRLDAETAEQCRRSPLPYFIIYHPALTYFARDYGLQQISIEHDGKEPSAKRMTQLIDRARRDGIDRIFCQKQYPVSTVEVIASDIGARIIVIDPLREDVIENTEEITRLITSEQ